MGVDPAVASVFIDDVEGVCGHRRDGSGGWTSWAAVVRSSVAVVAGWHRNVAWVGVWRRVRDCIRGIAQAGAGAIGELDRRQSSGRTRSGQSTRAVARSIVQLCAPSRAGAFRQSLTSPSPASSSLARVLLLVHRGRDRRARAGGGSAYQSDSGGVLAARKESGDRKHLRDRGVGAGVAPDFMTKRNSELVGIRDGAPPTPSVPRLAIRATPTDGWTTLAFTPVRVFVPTAPAWLRVCDLGRAPPRCRSSRNPRHSVGRPTFFGHTVDVW